ncbi:MAG: flagellar biosynthesis protein FlhB [Alphaproteobacteria bacterium]
MAEESDLSQKTEEPTLRRLDEARKKGQTASSREINHWFMIGAGSLWIAVFGPQVARDLGVVLLKFVESPHAMPTDSEHLRIILLHLMRDVAGVLALPVAIMTAGALAAGVLQGGFVIALDRIMPNLDRISLFSGAERLFSMRAILEFVKGIVKLCIVAAVVTMLMMPQMKGLANFTGLDMVQVAATIYDLSKSVFLDVLVVVSVIAALDFLYQRYEFRKSLRMSRQEMREEYKQTEGDPTIKNRLRQLRMERARRRMMAAVPEADVVITNPTHFAVALKYEPTEMNAPKMVAKGADLIAKKIREVALENDVAIVENPPLARALYSGVELDQEIPKEHYKAVAEIIGYVFRLKKKIIPG